jgi:hypothetical protein
MYSPQNNTTKTPLHLLDHNKEASRIKLRVLDHQSTGGNHIIARRSPSNTAQQSVQVTWLTKDKRLASINKFQMQLQYSIPGDPTY